jgi:Cu+-exporting ATPase
MTVPVTRTPSAEHVDPVCGMTVDPAEAAGSHHYGGRTYYFCNLRCLERFRERPHDYVAAAGGSHAPAATAVPGASRYVCPMDPEVRQPGPGPCPKCGMALEADLSDPAALTRVDYTCPMHPEIVRVSVIGNALRLRRIEI